MKLVFQIVAGILIAGFISSLAWLTVTSAVLKSWTDDLHRSTPILSPQAAQRSMQGSQDAIRKAAEDMNRAAQERLDAARAEAERRRLALQLKPGESCLGAFGGRPGTVVVRSVSPTGVPQAAQLIENSRPVQCVGNERVN